MTKLSAPKEPCVRWIPHSKIAWEVARRTLSFSNSWATRIRWGSRGSNQQSRRINFVTSRWGYAKVKFRKIETNVGYDLTNQRWLVCLALVWESIIAELTRSVSCRNLWFQKENPSFNHSRISYITHAPITNFSDPCFLGKVPALAPSVWRHLQVLNNHRIWYSTMEECKAQEITRKTVLWRTLLNLGSPVRHRLKLCQKLSKEQRGGKSEFSELVCCVKRGLSATITIIS